MGALWYEFTTIKNIPIYEPAFLLPDYRMLELITNKIRFLPTLSEAAHCVTKQNCLCTLHIQMH